LLYEIPLAITKVDLSLIFDLLADPAGSGTIPFTTFHRYSMRSWAWVVGVEAAGVVK